MTHDPFDTAGIRARVLAAWVATPARFREDANAEEDLALGGYRDRLVVELAQNAADAAARAGVPGRLRLAVRELEGQAVLVAANTGAPLDAAGVSALATLRASAKREGDTVGRFGVGFAAVLAVTDEPAVICRGGGVRFSAGDTRLLVADAGSLAEELTRRDGHVPVLRLPFPAEGTPPDGYDTAVILPLRDAAAEDLVLRLLGEVDDALLLALPALAEVVVERPGLPDATVRDVAGRWHVLRREGRHEAHLLADRPTEERAVEGWSLTWALPREGTAAHAPGVLRAPTPTDEPLPWPALLLATFPLDPSRRHVAPGPATDALAAHAAAAYADLLAGLAAGGEDVWHLLPSGAPAGAVDTALRAGLADAVPAAALLRSAEDPALVLRPRDAVVLDPPAGSDRDVVAALAPWLAGLVARPRGGPPPARYGVRELSLADLVEALPAVGEPARWRSLYAALAPLAGDPLVREALAALPVPLADGRVVRAPRGVVMFTQSGEDGGDVAGQDGSATAAALVALGVRTVHPDAAHPLLERLGAVPSSARAVLELPAVRSAVEQAAALADDDVTPFGEESPGPEDVADAVLHLVSLAVAADALEPGDLPWLGDLPLADADGEPAAADELVLPGSDAERWFDASAVGVVADELVEAWGADALAAAGVLTGPAPLHAQDVPLDPDADVADVLDGWDAWADHVRDTLAAVGPEPLGAAVPELLAVRDLDLVRDEALADAVVAIATDPRRRPALVAPAQVVAGSRRVAVDSYTSWWLRDRLGAPLAAGGSLAGLLPAAPGWVTRLDPVARRAAGVVDGVAGVGADAVPDLLKRLGDPALTVGPAVLLDVLRRLGELAADGAEAPSPDAVRCLGGAGTVVVPASRAMVVDAPMYRQRADLGRETVPAPPSVAAALADLLDLPLARELAPGDVAEQGAAAGMTAAVPAAALALLPAAPREWCEHDVLLVDGVDVAWWVDDDGPGGRVHAATLEGLALGLAWSAGRWDRRAAVAEVLADPGALADVLVDEAFGAR